MNQRYTQVKEIEHRIRASMAYSRWVERNQFSSCVRCGSTDKLQVHHIVYLYHIILGLWKFYGDWEQVFQHAIAMHDENRCEGITICEKCHDVIHPGRAVAVKESDLHLADWCVLPRKPEVKFSLGVKGREPGSIGLLGFQTMFYLGWGAINGCFSGGVVEFNWRRCAEHLDKTPSVSFCNGLESALQSLSEASVVSAFIRDGMIVRVRLSVGYMEQMRRNPWFVPLADVQTSKMTVLMLRWFMGFQSNRSSYVIGRDKLAGHLQINTRTPAFISRCVQEAAKDVAWIKISEDKDNFRFQICNRGMVPIHSLRSHLGHTLSL